MICSITCFEQKTVHLDAAKMDRLAFVFELEKAVYLIDSCRNPQVLPSYYLVIFNY